jgi:hypothetical protein
MKMAITRRTGVPSWALFLGVCAAIILFAAFQAEARHSANHVIVASRHVGSASFGRRVIVSNPNVSGQVVVFNRAMGRLMTLDRRSFGRFASSFGLFGSFGLIDGGISPIVTAPSFAIAPNAPQPAPSISAGDLPPCRETTPAGVVIGRGTNCSHASR